MSEPAATPVDSPPAPSEKPTPPIRNQPSLELLLRTAEEQSKKRAEAINAAIEATRTASSAAR